MGGVALSRWGLWLFDMAVSQEILEEVAGGERSAFAGVLSAIQQGLFCVILLASVVFSAPSDFYGLAFLSLAVTLLTACGYSIWFCACSQRPR